MWHRQGKVNLTKGSDVVTGVGTNWVENIRVGDAFQGPDGKLYQVINVASNEALAISPAYEGNTATNLNYWVVPVPGYSKTQADRLSLIISRLDGDIVTATEAANQAKEAATQAQQWKVEAAASAVAAQSSELSAAQSADRAEQARDDAVVVVTEGQGSLTPAPGKFPVAGTSGTIKQDWIENLQFELDALRVARNKLMYGDGPYPVLDMQFQGAKVLDPRITFTRASKDWDSQGREYGIDEPVLTNEGWFTNRERVNYLTQNKNLDIWTRQRVEVESSGELDPLGGNTGVIFKITSTAGGEARPIRDGVTVPDSSHFCVSYYLKKGGSQPISTARIFVIFYISESGFPTGINIDLDTVTAVPMIGLGTPYVSNVSVREVGNGWLRASFAIDASSITSPTMTLHLNVGSPPFLGGTICYAYPQIEAGVYPSPVIPTEASQVTVARSFNSMDISALDLNDFSVIYRGDAQPHPSRMSNYLWGLSDGVTTSEFIGARIREISLLFAETAKGNSGGVGIDPNGLRVGISVKGTSLILVANGGEVEQQITLSGPLDMNVLRILQLGMLTTTNSYVSNGTHKNVMVFNEPLTVEQLKELTS